MKAALRGRGGGGGGGRREDTCTHDLSRRSLKGKTLSRVELDSMVGDLKKNKNKNKNNRLVTPCATKSILKPVYT